MINETAMSEMILDALYNISDNLDISTFEENGLLTKNKGIVVKLWDGSEFHITIVKFEWN